MRKRLPKKHEILERAIEISMGRDFRTGMPAITPTEAELKESGVYHEARIELMSSRPEEMYGATTQKQALEDQKKYVDTMASEMGLKLVSRKEYRKYEKGVTDEWRFLQKVKSAEFEREKLRKSWLGALQREKKLKRKQAVTREQLRKVEAFDVFKVKYPSHVVKVNGFKITVPSFQKPKAPPRKPRKLRPFISKAPVKPKRKKKDVPMGMFGPISVPITRKYRVAKRISDWKIGQIVNMPTNVDTHSLVRRGFLTKLQPTLKAKPKRKRQKLHTQRNGKTMRKLRKHIKNGKKVFAFPDSVWKVRK